MLDLPRVVDAEPVTQLDLVEGVLEELELAAFPPQARQLVLVEDAEAHAWSPWLQNWSVRGATHQGRRRRARRTTPVSYSSSPRMTAAMMMVARDP